MTLLRRTPTTTWVLLMGLSVVTTWVVDPDHVGTAALPLIFVLVGAKVWLVVHDFMELRDAPLVGRLVFEGWAVVAPAVLAALAWR